jgi:hypothetical protein
MTSGIMTSSATKGSTMIFLAGVILLEILGRLCVLLGWKAPIMGGLIFIIGMGSGPLSLERSYPKA